MNTLKETIVSMICQPALSGLATITDEGLPWTRYVMTIGREDLTLRCATFVHARKVTHINTNPEVHINRGITDPFEVKPYLQIQGHAAFTTDKAERHALWNPSLAKIFDGPDDPKYGVIIITPYRIELWNPRTV